MRTLFLHIGFHKTGTTSLQQSLYKSRDLLLKHNWKFLSLDKLGNSSSYISIQKKTTLEYKVKSKFFIDIAKPNQDNVIISGEHFSFLNTKEELLSLQKGINEHFNNIKIIVYLRRQDKLALSFKQQAAKSPYARKMPSSLICGHSDSALPELTENIKQYLDFNKKIRLWCEVFGKDTLHIRIFEPDKLIGKDICTDFSHVTNIPVSLEKLRVNEGVSRVFSLYSHKLLRLSINPEIIKKIRRKTNTNKEKILPSYEEALTFYSHFSHQNKSLFQWLKHSSVFNPDFSHYPKITNHLLSVKEERKLLSSLMSEDTINLTAHEIATLGLSISPTRKHYISQLLLKKLGFISSLITHKRR